MDEDEGVCVCVGGGPHRAQVKRSPASEVDGGCGGLQLTLGLTGRDELDVCLRGRDLARQDERSIQHSWQRHSRSLPQLSHHLGRVREMDCFNWHNETVVENAGT